MPILPERFVDFSKLEAHGIRLDARERQRFLASMVGWMLSQFLHGEQGALMAAAQVTEAVQFFDGKLYGEFPVVAIEAVPQAGIIGRAIDSVRLWFN